MAEGRNHGLVYGCWLADHGYRGYAVVISMTPYEKCRDCTQLKGFITSFRTATENANLFDLKFVTSSGHSVVLLQPMPRKETRQKSRFHFKNAWLEKEHCVSVVEHG